MHIAAYVSALFLVLCLAKPLAGGMCEQYGHSCWGGHGKRSSTLNQYENDASHVAKPPDWRLLKGSFDLRTLLNGLNREHRKNYRGNDQKLLKTLFQLEEQRELWPRPHVSQDAAEFVETSKNGDLSGDSLEYSSPQQQEEDPSRLRIYEILNQNVLEPQSAG